MCPKTVVFAEIIREIEELFSILDAHKTGVFFILESLLFHICIERSIYISETKWCDESDICIVRVILDGVTHDLCCSHLLSMHGVASFCIEFQILEDRVVIISPHVQRTSDGSGPYIVSSIDPQF